MLKRTIALIIPTLLAGIGLNACTNKNKVNVDTGNIKSNVDVKVNTNVKVDTNVKIGKTKEKLYSNTTEKAQCSISKVFAEKVNEVYFDGYGAVEVTGSDLSDTTICFNYEVQGPSIEKCRQISEKIEAVCSIDNGKLSIDYFCDGQHFDKSLSELYNDYNLSAALVINIPNSVDVLNIHTVLGNLALHNFCGNANFSTEQGNIDLDSVRFFQDSIISTNIGIITANDIDLGECVKVCTKQGNVNLDSVLLSEGSLIYTNIGNINANNIDLNGSSEIYTHQGNFTFNSDKLFYLDGVLKSRDNDNWNLKYSSDIGNVIINGESVEK